MCVCVCLSVSVSVSVYVFVCLFVCLFGLFISVLPSAACPLSAGRVYDFSFRV